MSPSNLGVIASQISGHLWAPSGAYDSIATTTVGAGGAATVTFSSIPSTYTHLQIRWIARNASTNATDSFGINFNSDTGANYAWHWLYGTGSSVSAYGTGSQTAGLIECTSGAGATSGIFGGGYIDILDYANTTKYKTVRSLGGADANGSGGIFLMSSLWQNTNAVSTILLTSNSGNFQQYSQFALYGIKGN